MAVLAGVAAADIGAPTASGARRLGLTRIAGAAPKQRRCPLLGAGHRTLSWALV